MIQNRLFAKQLTLFMKNGFTIDYSHVTKLEVKGKLLLINGETDDMLQIRKNVFCKHPTEHIEAMFVRFYSPKEE